MHARLCYEQEENLSLDNPTEIKEELCVSINIGFVNSRSL